jgi:hypothetical protein
MSEDSWGKKLLFGSLSEYGLLIVLYVREPKVKFVSNCFAMAFSEAQLHCS